MHHHTENESSLFCCVVFFSFVSSSLVFSLLFRLRFSLCPCLLSLSSSSVSVCLCLSLSPCVVVCCSLCVVLCCVLFCVVWWCVVCGVAHWKKPVRPLNTSPCVRSKRPHIVPAPRAHMLKYVYAWCRYERGRFERTHGDVVHR